MDELFEEIKTYLDITWDMTAAEEKKLRGSIKRGMAYLGGKIGRCNFTKIRRKKPCSWTTACTKEQDSCPNLSQL